MKLNNGLNIFNKITKNQTNIIDTRNKNRQKTINTLIFAMFDIKTRYDSKYKTIEIKMEKKVYIKFHYEYRLSRLKNKKLFNQKIEFFKILNKYKKLAYKLNIPKI